MTAGRAPRAFCLSFQDAFIASLATTESIIRWMTRTLEHDRKTLEVH